MSQSEQPRNRNQEQILNIREEINFQFALLESLDESVLNRQALEKSIREQIRELQQRFNDLRLKSDSTGVQLEALENKYQSTQAEPIVSYPLHENYAIDSGNSRLKRPTSIRRYEAQTPHFHKRNYDEFSGSSTLSPCQASEFKRLTLDPSNTDQNISSQNSPIRTNILHEFENDYTETLVKQQRALEERIRLERLDEQYARRLQAEIEASPSTSLHTYHLNCSGLPNPECNTILNTSEPQGPSSRLTWRSQKVPQHTTLRFSSESNGEPSVRNKHTTVVDLDDDSDKNLGIALDLTSSDNESELEIISSNTFSTGISNYQDKYKPRIKRSHFPETKIFDNSRQLNYTRNLPYQTTPSPFFQGEASTAYHDYYNSMAKSSYFPETNLFNHSRQSNYVGNLCYQPSPCPSFQGESSRSSGKIETDFSPISVTLPKSYYDIEVTRSKIIEECKELAKNVSLDTDTRREETPEGLVNPLYEHQKIALSWLKSKEESVIKGGVLADDMGLGKTISALALVLSRPSSNINNKTTLIVGPVALIRQWEREIRVKIKKNWRLSTIVLHGSSKKYGWDDICHYDVVLTTYGTLASEFKRFERCRDSHPGQKFDAATLKKNFPLVGPKSRFYRIILDEAQSIKNKNTHSAKACFHLNATYRICLTGTPMMNNVIELFSVILFLRVKPYNEWNRFMRDFGILSKATATETLIKSSMKKLQALLKAILLRRTKESLIDGKSIISLPPKIVETQHVAFDEDESAFYYALEARTKIKFNNYLAAGAIGRNYSFILVLLLRLRQACCHKDLIHDFDQATSKRSQLKEDEMIQLAKTLPSDVVDRLLNCDGAFECPICYDGVENPQIIIPCGHDTCAECLSKITDQQALQRATENEADHVSISKCHSCRGPLILSKIIDYTTFKKVHDPKGKTSNKNVQNETDSETESDSEPEIEGEVNNNGDLRKFILSDSTEADEFQSSCNGRNKGKGKRGDKREKNSHLSLAMLKQEANKSAANRRRYMKYLKARWQPSAKITKCMELVRKFLEEKHKILIFSQFVSLLDLLQVPIDEEKWNCLRYDGSMSADLRHAAVEKFSDTTTHNIMLLSLKAGNAGLNLVSASRVIILDPFWNPYIEMQAIDRAHRIGQQNTVEVHRILIKDTVEDRIIELQDRKRKLVDMALDEGAARSLGRLNEAQLIYLFGGTSRNEG